ncbi:MAG: hypothetical protein BGN88_11990 [Clostridiales bacterium 43-6]|nr:MAG: hypothetical protein BGN88_11990 [Clostridiales bacterium 43-6]
MAFLKKNKTPSTVAPRRDSIARPKSDISVVEAYRTIRTNFMFAINKKDKCKKIIFTSPVPRDGKSTTCVNLGISLAQIDAKVLLIDCDMRKPRIHKFFNCDNTPGLSNVLGGFNELSETIKQTDHHNLFIIPSGIIPPNPAELLSGPRMANIMEELETMFDFILVDTPPCNVVSDALLLTKICDGVILIVKQSVTIHPDLTRCIKSLEFINADILGIILNEATQNRKYTYKKYKYGEYRYGYNYSSY